MSSIRPLATITLLAAMGIFLYLKINETPESATSQAPAEWEGAPKFEFGDSTTTSGGDADSAVPTFTPPPAPSADKPVAPPSVEPALPDLPPISAPPVVSSSEPSANVAPPDVEANSTPAPSVESTAVTPAAEENANAASSAPDAPPSASLPGLPPIPELPPLPETAATNEAPGPVAPAPPDFDEAAEPTTTIPSASPFDAARPAIHAALSQGELARALQLVSKWYNDPALLPEEQEEVQTLLNQLAGTVVYSNEHHLEPAYSVQAGETMETIAAQHHVPWQLLAKINGIPSATAIQPGQTIKVIRGPFMGVVDVSDGELTLTIDGRFAGKFPVQLAGAAASEGEWSVEQKHFDPAYGTSPADRKLVLRSGDNTSATVVIASATTPLAGTASPQGTIRIAPEQAEDLYDILSVGSRVVIRR